MCTILTIKYILENYFKKKKKKYICKTKKLKKKYQYISRKMLYKNLLNL